jgi:hypothetical protein
MNRSACAIVAGLTPDGMKAAIRRNLIPTLRDNPGRMMLDYFDAWILAVMELACRDGGLRRTFLANIFHDHLTDLRDIARRADTQEEPGLVILIEQDSARNVHLLGGHHLAVLGEFTMDMQRRRSTPSRMTIIDVNTAAAEVRARATEVGVELGPIGEPAATRTRERVN